MVMEEILQRLENQIKKLIARHDQLKQANYELYKGKYILSREKESLLAKQHKAISQIEMLMSKLMSIEK